MIIVSIRTIQGEIWVKDIYPQHVFELSGSRVLLDSFRENLEKAVRDKNVENIEQKPTLHHQLIESTA